MKTILVVFVFLASLHLKSDKTKQGRYFFSFSGEDIFYQDLGSTLGFLSGNRINLPWETEKVQTDCHEKEAPGHNSVCGGSALCL